MAKYAEHTRVPIGRSRDEIERTLVRYGADGFYYGADNQSVAIAFKFKKRAYKFTLPLPKRSDYRPTKAGEQLWERELRSLWRALLLGIKAKLELVERGWSSFENEFLAQTCLPEGDTIAERIQIPLDKYLAGGKMPPLLTGTQNNG